MKIENLLNGSLSLSKIGSRSEKVDHDFHALLEEAKKRHEPPFPLNINEIRHSEFQCKKHNIKLLLEGLSIGDRVLEKIETYQKALENYEITFKHLESLATSLQEEIDKIKDISEKLPQTDPLRKILKEMEIVGTVEVLKCKQGKYI